MMMLLKMVNLLCKLILKNCTSSKFDAGGLEKLEFLPKL